MIRAYKSRKIQFDGLVRMDDWVVKIYTITPRSEFRSIQEINRVKVRLPELLSLATDHHQNAFVIVHEGMDGLWTLVNWWTGGEMLRTDTYFTSYDRKQILNQFPREGAMACVWEMAVINHERSVWITQVLKKPIHPDFVSYHQDIIEGEI